MKKNTHIHTYTHTHIHTYTHTHIHTHTHTYIYTHIHTHTHTYTRIEEEESRIGRVQQTFLPRYYVSIKNA